MVLVPAFLLVFVTGRVMVGVLALSAGAQQAVGAVMVAIIAALATYIVDRRKNSGDIRNSTAADLWQAELHLREAWKSEVIRVTALYETEHKARVEAEGRERKLLERVAVLENRVNELVAEHG